MKNLVEYINENKNKFIEADDIKGPVTCGEYNGEKVVVIGKPFTNDRDEAYIMAKEYIKKLGYKVLSVDFVEPMIYEDGTSGNWEVNVETDKEFVWNSKSYKVFRRCEDKLIKKFNLNLFV